VAPLGVDRHEVRVSWSIPAWTSEVRWTLADRALTRVETLTRARRR
jgi:hypothetical protein